MLNDADVLYKSFVSVKLATTPARYIEIAESPHRRTSSIAVCWLSTLFTRNLACFNSVPNVRGRHMQRSLRSTTGERTCTCTTNQAMLAHVKTYICCSRNVGYWKPILEPSNMIWTVAVVFTHELNLDDGAIAQSRNSVRQMAYDTSPHMR